MNCSLERKDKLINYIPIVSGILLVCFGVAAFGYSEPADIFLNNGLLAVAYPLLFMLTGYKFGLAQKGDSAKTVVNSQFKHIGIIYAFCAVATLCSSFATEGVQGLKKVLWILTGGIPSELWFVPAGMLAVFAFAGLKKKFTTKSIVKISVVLYIISLLVTIYGGEILPFLNSVKSSAELVFAGSHCGFFSALLFVSLGVKYSENGVKGKTSKYVLGLCAAFFLLLIEIVILSLLTDVTRVIFFLSSVPFSMTIFSLLLKAPDIKIGMDFITNIGSVAICIGQLLCSICNKITAVEGFMFAGLFSTPSKRIEVILLLSFVIAVAVYAYFGEGRWADNFAYSIESTILFALRPFAYVMTAFGDEIKNVVMMLSFGTLPVLLWFFERGIKNSLCSDIFVYCLVAIVLCSLSYPMKATKKNGTMFSLFLFMVIVLYLSAKTYNVGSYNQMGRMLLFFFIPLATIVSNRKDFLPELFKNYTAGIYLSFVAFISYCLMFRPYDITRYKGAFCNSNMCGLYLVVVCVVALWNIPNKFDKKSFSKNFLHWAVFGIGFGFLLLTISRTAFVGAVVAAFVKVCAVVAQAQLKNKNILQKVKTIFMASMPFIPVIVVGLIIVYVSVRFIPGIIDCPAYLINEITGQMEYKVLPGAKLTDENYISPLRFLQAWLNRSLTGYETVNDLSTGRVTIYLEYLKKLSFNGHMYERISIEGEPFTMLAHNVFLQIAYNCGIVTGVLYLVYCAFCIINGSYRYLKKDAFALFPAIGISAYAACGMFESMEAYYYPLLFTAFLGLLPLLCNQREQDLQAAANSSELLMEQTRVKLRMQKAISIVAVLTLCMVLIYLVFAASEDPNKYILDEMLK